MTDPIADMLARIRNATLAKHERVDILGSKMNLKIAEILKEEGFIEDFKFIEDGKQGIIRIFLKYDNLGRSVIEGLKRVSKPGRRIYVKKDEIPRVRGGLGIAILSTSSGVMTDKKARELGVGGEVLCFIW